MLLNYLFTSNVFVIITDPKSFFSMSIRSMSSWIWIHYIPVIILNALADLLTEWLTCIFETNSVFSIINQKKDKLVTS